MQLFHTFYRITRLSGNVVRTGMHDVQRESIYTQLIEGEDAISGNDWKKESR